MWETSNEEKGWTYSIVCRMFGKGCINRNSLVNSNVSMRS